MPFSRTPDFGTHNLLQLVNVNVSGYSLRNHDALRLPIRRRNYDFHESVCGMMRGLNVFFYVYDFNVSSERFADRIR